MNPSELVKCSNENICLVIKFFVKYLAASCAGFPGWRYQRLWWCNLSSWGWAACCSKHVEDRSV